MNTAEAAMNAGAAPTAGVFAVSLLAAAFVALCAYGVWRAAGARGFLRVGLAAGGLVGCALLASRIGTRVGTPAASGGGVSVVVGPRAQIDPTDVVAATPRIVLSDDKPAPDPATEEPVDGDNERPEWVTAEPKANQKVLVSGPFATVDACRVDSREQVIAWAWSATGLDPPDFGAGYPPEFWSAARSALKDQLTVAEHLEPREIAGGEVYLLHTLAEIDEDTREWVRGRAAEWAALARRERGFRAVAVGGGLAVLAIAVLHGILRVGVADRRDD